MNYLLNRFIVPLLALFIFAVVIIYMVIIFIMLLFIYIYSYIVHTPQTLELYIDVFKYYIPRPLQKEDRDKIDAYNKLEKIMKNLKKNE